MVSRFLGGVAVLGCICATPAAAGTVAFTSSGDGRADVTLADSGGGPRTRLTDGRGDGSSSMEPSWSPDGRRIAFASDRGDPQREQSDIHVMLADGSQVYPVTAGPGDDRHPAWSPDGERIAFTRLTREGERFRISIVTARSLGGDERTVSGELDAAAPAWSPDGTTIAFTAFQFREDTVDFALYLVGADGSGLRKLADQASDAAWSPDGRTLVFVSYADRNGERCGSDECFPAGEIYVMNADGEAQRRLTADASDDGAPSWSPDGRRIAFDSDRFYPQGESHELWTMHADGSCQVRFSAGAAQARGPDWRPEPGSPDEPLPPLLPPAAEECETPALTWEGPDLTPARAFRRFPLLWLGETFEGVAVTSVGRPDPRTFVFDYRDCPDPSGACGEPVDLQIASSCDRHPLRYGTDAAGRRAYVRRGALVIERGVEQGADVYTGSVALGVYGRSGRAALERVVAALRPLAAAEPTAGRLPRPAFPRSMLAALRRTERLARRHGVAGAHRRLRISRRAVRERLRLSRALRRLPAAPRAARCR